LRSGSWTRLCKKRRRALIDGEGETRLDTEVIPCTYHLPGHPSYFNEVEYTQEEVEAVIRHVRDGHKSFSFVFLREPDQEPGIVFDTSGKVVPVGNVEMFRANCLANLQSFITTMNTRLRANRTVGK
jgi:hypothetical protein